MREPSNCEMTLLIRISTILCFHQSTMGTSRSMDSPDSVEQSMAGTIAPPPLELSPSALYVASITAFLGSVLALSLAVSYIVCAFPLPVSLAYLRVLMI
jgi:hypothetical protein